MDDHDRPYHSMQETLIALDKVGASPAPQTPLRESAEPGAPSNQCEKCGHKSVSELPLYGDGHRYCSICGTGMPTEAELAKTEDDPRSAAAGAITSGIYYGLKHHEYIDTTGDEWASNIDEEGNLTVTIKFKAGTWENSGSAW